PARRSSARTVGVVPLESGTLVIVPEQTSSQGNVASPLATPHASVNCVADALAGSARSNEMAAMATARERFINVQTHTAQKTGAKVDDAVRAGVLITAEPDWACPLATGGR